MEIEKIFEAQERICSSRFIPIYNINCQLLLAIAIFLVKS